MVLYIGKFSSFPTFNYGKPFFFAPTGYETMTTLRLLSMHNFQLVFASIILSDYSLAQSFCFGL